MTTTIVRHQAQAEVEADDAAHPQPREPSRPITSSIAPSKSAGGQPSDTSTTSPRVASRRDYTWRLAL